MTQMAEARWCRHWYHDICECDSLRLGSFKFPKFIYVFFTVAVARKNSCRYSKRRRDVKSTVNCVALLRCATELLLLSPFQHSRRCLVWVLTEYIEVIKWFLCVIEQTNFSKMWSHVITHLFVVKEGQYAARSEWVSSLNIKYECTRNYGSLET